MTPEFSAADKAQFAERSVDEKNVAEQMSIFRRGIPFADLDRACTINDGITRISENTMAELFAFHEEAARRGRLMKFVPASGAASRMFKDLLAVSNAIDDGSFTAANLDDSSSEAQTFRKFLQQLARFPFFAELEVTGDIRPENAFENGRLALTRLLDQSALGFAALPKGLIPFHKTDGSARTPFEEHLVEGDAYAKDAGGKVRIHFTVPAHFKQRIDDFISRRISQGNLPAAEFQIDYSVQKSSTDTVAVDPDNQPFRNEDGIILFRPGGHGALLENLNDLDGDIVFIKNIDNVLPDYRKETTIRYKKALAGYLIKLQTAVFDFLKLLVDGEPSPQALAEMIAFAENELYLTVPQAITEAETEQQITYLKDLFDRPIRVCGMVKNEGEPGGGPFWVRDGLGNSSAQIVESSQINKADPDQAAIVENATHFNPVDLICGIKNFRGESFDLLRYRDDDAGFISQKSKDGRDLKALELPGLWNGAMAFWNTIFVEVPAETFSPVKTVFDLLRPEHQGGA